MELHIEGASQNAVQFSNQPINLKSSYKYRSVPVMNDFFFVLHVLVTATCLAGRWRKNYKNRSHSHKTIFIKQDTQNLIDITFILNLSGDIDEVFCYAYLSVGATLINDLTTKPN